MLTWLKSLKLQPSTVVGIAFILTAIVMYVVTGNAVWFGLVTGAVAIVIPDNSSEQAEAMAVIKDTLAAMGKSVPLLVFGLFAAFGLVACSSAGSNLPTLTSAQVQQVEGDVANVAALVAQDAPLFVGGGASTTVADAAKAVQSAAATLSQQGASSTTVAGVANALEALVAAAKADPQLASDSQVQTDLTMARVAIGAAAALYQIVEPGLVPSSHAPPTAEAVSIDAARAYIARRLLGP